MRVRGMLLAAVLLTYPALAGEETQTNDVSNVSTDKPTFRTLLERCASNQKDTTSSIEKVLSTLDNATTSDDLNEIKKAISSARETLAKTREKTAKSCTLLNKARKHVDKIHKSADTKTRQLIDQPDPDFDEVIWAY